MAVAGIFENNGPERDGLDLKQTTRRMGCVEVFVSWTAQNLGPCKLKDHAPETPFNTRDEKHSHLWALYATGLQGNVVFGVPQI